MFDGPGVLGIKAVYIQIVLLDVDGSVVNRGMIGRTVNEHSLHIAVGRVTLVETIPAVLPAEAEVVRPAPDAGEVTGESIECHAIDGVDVVVSGGIEYRESGAVEDRD